MGKYLPDKVSALDKAGWKKAREEAGFDATLFGGPAIGSKLDEFKAMRGKIKPSGSVLKDMKNLNAYILAAVALKAAFLEYQKKALKGGKKQNLDFAAELKTLADKMEKKIVKAEIQHKKIHDLIDQATDGKLTDQEKAVDGLFKDLLVI
ncbi:MAG: hypothetical protein EA381_01850 [Planctomycetaceae bacterium]|nr:MAG: hypothetical protein EA381_01850 [Planctomycetaceae bacterium]